MAVVPMAAAVTNAAGRSQREDTSFRHRNMKPCARFVEKFPIFFMLKKFIDSVGRLPQNVKPSHRSFSLNSSKLNFDDSTSAFGSKTTWELVLGITIFKICSFQPFVKNSQFLLGTNYFLQRTISIQFSLFLLDVSRRVLGERLTLAVVRRTFFQHFCAGVDADDIRPCVSRLRSNGVGAILGVLFFVTSFF